MEELGSSLKVGRQVRGVEVMSWDYPQGILSLAGETQGMSQTEGEGHSVFLSDEFCRGKGHRGKGHSI